MASTPSQVMIYLCASNAAELLDFYKAAFAAEELMRWVDPGPGKNQGKIGHSEIRIGSQMFYVVDGYDEMGELGFKSPAALGGSPVIVWLHVDDLAGALARALAAGAKLLKPIHSSEHSNPRCRIADPSGHIWTLAQA
jgi:PhnB protein